jgi:aspartate aminotransferase
MDRIATLKPTAVNAILAEVRLLQASGKKITSLMRGEPDFPTPPHIVEACTKALANGRTRYPDNRGEKALLEAVAAKLQRDNGLTYDPGTEIIATSGATFGIYAALAAILEDGDEVLLQDPVYDAYHSPIKLLGGVPVPVHSQIVAGRFSLTAEALEAAWTPRAKVLILNTPWNPVGSVLTRDELTAVAEFCERRNLWLVGDEIYEAITYDGAKHLSAPAAAPQIRDRYIHVNSLSKTYSMPGWRVGYCAGPAAVIQRMFMVLAQSSRGPATFIQDAAAVALAGPQDCVSEMRAEYTRRRAKVLAALQGIPNVGAIAPEGGFFAMADIRALNQPSNEVRKRLLEEHGLVVIHGSAYGPGGEGTLRVSFASGGQILDQGLSLLRQGLA